MNYLGLIIPLGILSLKPKLLAFSGHNAASGHTGKDSVTGFAWTALIRLGRVWHCSEMVLSISSTGVKFAGTNEFTGTKILASREQ